MADENKDQEKKDQENKDQGSEKPSFKNAEELTSFLMDLQGQIANMQQTVDKLSPVEEGSEGETTEGDQGGKDEELSDDEINEIDRLLQSE